jgi:3'-5' exoribonuclease
VAGSQFRPIELDHPLHTPLLAGAVLHDVGKVYELSYERSFGYTTEGQLLGHMVIGLRIVGDKLRGLPDFPPRLRTLVEHMIVSHHGRYEFGSPKLPQFPEALLFHYLDDMDSKMECMRALVEQDRQVDGHFTSYNLSLERTVLKKAKYMANAAEIERPAERTPAVRTPVERTPAARAPGAAQLEQGQPQSAPAPSVSPGVPLSGAKPVPKEASHPLFAAPPAQES